MIAEDKSRRKGLASEALLLMMKWGADQFGLQGYVAKIIENNTPSIRLFEKLGFKEFARVEAFEEVHFKLLLSDHPVFT